MIFELARYLYQGIATIGVLCGGFTEASLREAGCADVYPGPAALFARFDKSLLSK